MSEKPTLDEVEKNIEKLRIACGGKEPFAMLSCSEPLCDSILSSIAKNLLTAQTEITKIKVVKAFNNGAGTTYIFLSNHQRGL